MAEKSLCGELGIDIGIFAPGPLDAITDVEGVAVGHETVVRGEGPLKPGEGPVRTGVTAIFPRVEGSLFARKPRAGCYVLNGFGKSTGFHQIRELGTLETPILLTNTLSANAAADALVAWCLGREPEIGVSTGTVNPLVGDINDGYLNDIRGLHIGRSQVFAALAAAKIGGFARGSVGGGTGASCLGFKGGIGTASRRLPARFGGWTIGVLAQTNYGGMLSVNGAPIGRELGVFDFSGAPDGFPQGHVPAGDALGGDVLGCTAPDGSCMVVIATDAPLDSRQLTRLARRGGLGLSRTGFYSSNGSGDFFIAFTTANPVPHEYGGGADRAAAAHGAAARGTIAPFLSDDALSPLFAALVEAVEEAAIDSLLSAKTMVGRDNHRREALDHDVLVKILDKYNARHWASRLPGA